MGDIVSNFAMNSLNPHLIIKKLNLVFDDLKHAAELNLVVGFTLKNVENDSCRSFSPQEKTTLMEQPRLVATSKV